MGLRAPPRSVCGSIHPHTEPARRCWWATTAREHINVINVIPVISNNLVKTSETNMRLSAGSVDPTPAQPPPCQSTKQNAGVVFKIFFSLRASGKPVGCLGRLLVPLQVPLLKFLFCCYCYYYYAQGRADKSIQVLHICMCTHVHFVVAVNLQTDQKKKK